MKWHWSFTWWLCVSGWPTKIDNTWGIANLEKCHVIMGMYRINPGVNWKWKIQLLDLKQENKKLLKYFLTPDNILPCCKLTPPIIWLRKFNDLQVCKDSIKRWIEFFIAKNLLYAGHTTDDNFLKELPDNGSVLTVLFVQKDLDNNYINGISFCLGRHKMKTDKIPENQKLVVVQVKTAQLLVIHY